MEVRNTTRAPVKVPLPQGKRLFLAPGRSGQITPKAAEHAPVAALIESGDLEVVAGGKSKGSGGSSAGVSGSQKTDGAGGVRHTGDR